MDHKMLVKAQLHFCWAVAMHGLDCSHCWPSALREVCMTLLLWRHLPLVPRDRGASGPCGGARFHSPPWQRRCDGVWVLPGERGPCYCIRWNPRDSLRLPSVLGVFHWCIWMAVCQSSRRLVLLALWSVTSQLWHVHVPSVPTPIFRTGRAIPAGSWWWSKPKWWTVGLLKAPPLEVRWPQLETTLYICIGNEHVWTILITSFKHGV